MLVENIHHRLLDCMPMSKAKTIFKNFLIILLYIIFSIILTTIFKFIFSFAKTFDYFGKLL